MFPSKTRVFANLGLRIWSTYPERKGGPGEIKKNYQAVLNEIIDIFDGSGNLICNNFIGLLSAVGMIPGWFREETNCKATSRYMTYFQSIYDLKDLSKKDNCHRLLKDLQIAFETQFEKEFPLRMIENILCKAFRDDVGQTRTFSDTLKPHQDLFEFRKGGLLRVYRGSDVPRKQLDCQVIIERFPMGNNQPTMKQAVKILGIPNNINRSEYRRPPLDPRLFIIKRNPVFSYDVPSFRRPLNSYPDIYSRLIKKKITNLSIELKNANRISGGGII